jgi:hypothetical protein
MKIFTVHEPPLRRNESVVDPDRFVFVRDGFYFWAFLFGPLWMIWRRLWLVLLIYAVVIAALQVGLYALGMSPAVNFTVGFLIALLVGFEAATLRRWTLTRRRFRNLGPVVAPNLETAEHRFFDAWTSRVDMPPPIPSQAPQPPRPPAYPPSAPEVIGLFPEPQPRS